MKKTFTYAKNENEVFFNCTLHSMKMEDGGVEFIMRRSDDTVMRFGLCPTDANGNPQELTSLYYASLNVISLIETKSVIQPVDLIKAIRLK